MHLTDAVCKAFAEVNKPNDSIFNIIPHNAFYIAARRVLNPQNSIIGYKNTLISNVKWFSDHGGIENLIVFLGANHLVGTITNLSMNFATESDLTRFPFQRESTFYSVDLFKKALDELSEEINKMTIKNVFTSTIPYITHSPLIQEINHPALREPAFTHHWVNSKDFNPLIHPFLKKSDIFLIDKTISAYNDLIKENAKRFNWSVLPMDEIVMNLNPNYRDDLAPNPYPNASIRALKRNPKTKHLVTENGSVLLNTNYLELDKKTHLVSNGGIFSLDGIHPTTFAYGLIASGFMHLMQEKGVKFENSLDWDYIIREDTLLTDPPIYLRNLKTVLEFFSSDYKSMFSRLGSNLFAEISSLLGGRN